MCSDMHTSPLFHSSACCACTQLGIPDSLLATSHKCVTSVENLVLQVNPYEPEMNWFTDDTEIMPLSAAPEPKRRFIPSKWEEKK